MPRVYKSAKIVDTPPENKMEKDEPKKKSEKVEPKPEPSKKRSEHKKKDVMETDFKVLHKNLKEKDKELTKIKTLVDKINKIMDNE